MRNNMIYVLKLTDNEKTNDCSLQERIFYANLHPQNFASHPQKYNNYTLP